MLFNGEEVVLITDEFRMSLNITSLSNFVVQDQGNYLQVSTFDGTSIVH